MLWIGWLRMILEQIKDIGKQLENLDKDDSGYDDLVGGIIVGVGHIIEAILDFNENPQTQN